MDQDLPHFSADSFSRNRMTNDASARILDEMYIGWSVIAPSGTGNASMDQTNIGSGESKDSKPELKIDDANVMFANDILK